MKLPTRTIQQKNESDSFAIIQYKLKDIGIFRNMTENDFGIDFEIETVNTNKVDGHCIKVQVKSKMSNLVKKDRHAKIGGIKLSTLYYWAELSYNTPVIAMAVDTENGKENIYVSEPLFWQAIKLIDETRSKYNLINKEKYSTSTIDLGIYHNTLDNIKRLRNIAVSVSLRDFIYAHKWILYNFGKICDMLWEADGCDRFMPCTEPVLFENTLEQLSIVFNYTAVYSNFKERPQIPSYQDCNQKSNWDEPYNDIVCKVFKNCFLPVLPILIEYKQKILHSATYWLSKDFRYLKLVYITEIPDCKYIDEFVDYCSKSNMSSNKRQLEFTDFVLEKIRQAGLEDIDICKVIND